MTPERWQQIRDLLHSAMQLKVDERPAFLDRHCKNDSELRHELETLLSSNDEARSNFLENVSLQVALHTGSRLGDYEVQKLIGSGGMGEVYRARDLRLWRDVAIKVLPSFVSSDKERLRRFEQEAQAAAALNHPNILAVFQMGNFQGAPYLVSELLEGDTLRGQINRGPITARKAIDYGVQIAHGLAAAHEKRIVHRDLKPENLFATKDGRIKILDFGLAKLKQPEPSHQNSAPTPGGSVTEPGMIMGTAGYMSPEQVRGESVDHRTDIFAFGAILYEMLTGKRAFQKTTSIDTMSAILNEEPPPVSQVAANIPPALQRTVHRCLEKSPEQRFQSASDLAFALEALSDSAVTPLPRQGRAKPSTRNWRAIVPAAAAVILAIAALLWWQTPPAIPRVTGVKQLTDDGEPKLGGGAVVVTDGLRVYFTEGTGDSPKVVQVSTNGGQVSPVPTRFKNASVDDIAPDFSALLVDTDFGTHSWIQPLPAGEPRALAADAFGSPKTMADGHIVFTRGSSVYLANAEGSNPRKVAGVPGNAQGPVISPDGKRIRFTVVGDNALFSIWEVNTDGTGLRKLQLLKAVQEVAGGWTLDGKYFLFQTEQQGGRWDLWALPEDSGFFRRRTALVQLTNGPLSYENPVESHDGKQLFAVGSKKRGELIRYDSKSSQFVPYLSGISAVETRVSPDGEGVLYVSYPDHTLWRCRSDGSERAQLTFPPLMVFYPQISPDGSRVAFSGLAPGSGAGIYVLGLQGGTPEKVVEEGGHAPAWSPDGNSLAFGALVPGHHPYEDQSHWLEIHVVDLRTRKVSVVPTADNWFGPWWPEPDKLVSATGIGPAALHVFNFKTQQWSNISEPMAVDSWAPTSDGKSMYVLSTDLQGTQAVRKLRASDLKLELVANVTGMRLVYDDSLGQASGGQWIGVAADGSPTLTHDVGSDEIYALDVKWP